MEDLNLGAVVGIIALVVFAIFIISVIARSLQIVPQA